MTQIEGVDGGVRIGAFEPYHSIDQFGMVKGRRICLCIFGLELDEGMH